MKNYVNKFLAVALLASCGAALAMEKPTITMQISPSQTETLEVQKAELFNAINKSSLASVGTAQTKEDQIATHAREIENLFAKAADKKVLANAVDAKGWPTKHVQELRN